MSRLLDILALAAVLLQCCAVCPLIPGRLAESPSDMTLAAPPTSMAASIVLRRVSPLEPLLGGELGLVGSGHFVSASVNWPATLSPPLSGTLDSHNSLQALGIRWQI